MVKDSHEQRKLVKNTRNASEHVESIFGRLSNKVFRNKKNFVRGLRNERARAKMISFSKQ